MPLDIDQKITQTENKEKEVVMSQNKKSQHIKIDERNHVEKPLLNQLDRLGWGVIALMQDLLTDKKRVTALLTRVNENNNGKGVD